MALDKKIKEKLLDIGKKSSRYIELVKKLEAAYGRALQDEDYDLIRQLDKMIRDEIAQYDRRQTKLKGWLVKRYKKAKATKSTIALAKLAHEVVDIIVEKQGVIPEIKEDPFDV